MFFSFLPHFRPEQICDKEKCSSSPVYNVEVEYRKYARGIYIFISVKTVLLLPRLVGRFVCKQRHSESYGQVLVITALRKA